MASRSCTETADRGRRRRWRSATLLAPNTRVGHVPSHEPRCSSRSVYGRSVHCARVGRADGLLLSSPEYAHGIAGAFKNLLDWTVGGGEMDRKAVAWINTAGPAAPSGGEDAHASLRRVLGYLGATVVEAACVRIPVARQTIGADGLVEDEAARARIAAVLDTLLSHTHYL